MMRAALLALILVLATAGEALAATPTGIIVTGGPQRDSVSP